MRRSPCWAGSAPRRRAPRPGCRRPASTAAPDQPAGKAAHPAYAAGISPGRWPRPSGRRSWMRCTAAGSLTWLRTRSGRRCWTRAPTSARCPPTTGCCARPARAGSGAPGHPPRHRQARARRGRAEPGVLLGHHQAARPGEMDLLPPVCDPGHLQPVRRGLDGRHPRVRRPGREADRRDLRQTGHQPRPAEHPRRPRLLDDLQAGRAAARRPRRHPVPLPARTSATTTRTPRRSSRP